MKKWIMPIAVVAICILAASVAMPICLADQHRIEIEGRLTVDEYQVPLGFDTYKIGELHEGDEIKVVMFHMRGDGDINVLLGDNLMGVREGGLNILYTTLACLGNSSPAYCLPCYLWYRFFPKPTVSAIEETTIVHEGEEKTFTVPEEGIYYLVMEAERGTVIYEGHIEVIKTEKWGE